MGARLEQFHGCCIAFQNAREAPEGRKSLAHGASRGWERPRRISPGGAKEEGRSVFRPSGAWGNAGPRCPRAYALG